MALELVNRLPYDHPYRWDGTAVGGVKLWRPDELGASLALWLDAEDTASITLNGSTVSQWDDKSGNARHMVQAFASQQPQTGNATIGGKNAINFDTVGRILNSDSAASEWNFLHNTGGCEVFCVSNYDSIGSGLMPFLRTREVSSGTGYLLRYRDTDRFSSFIAENGVQILSTTSSNNAFPSASDTMFSTRHALSLTLDHKLDLHGTEISQANYLLPHAGGFDADLPLRMGGAVSRFGECIIIDGLLSDANRHKVQGYLAWKWGMEANLPSGHPYETAPPTV